MSLENDQRERAFLFLLGIPQASFYNTVNKNSWGTDHPVIYIFRQYDHI